MVSRCDSFFILSYFDGDIKTVSTVGLGWIKLAKGSILLTYQLTSSLQIQTIYLGLELNVLCNGRNSLPMHHVR